MRLEIARKYMLPVMLVLAMLPCSTGAQVAEDDIIVKTLEPNTPDSIHVSRDESDIRIRWYPKGDSVTSVVGSEFYQNWYYGHGESDRVEVDIIGYYTGMIDRKLTVSLESFNQYKIASAADGGDESIRLRVETTDKFWIYDNRTKQHKVIFETYSDRINIGTDYSYGDTLPVVLMGAQSGKQLDLGISLFFNDGLVDTTEGGSPAYFEIDLQSFEGFHVWRKEVRDGDPFDYPSQVEMKAIAEISKEEFHLYSRILDGEDVPPKRVEIWQYFTDKGEEEAYPRFDEEAGRYYFEWVDKNVFPGFKYFYSVSSYDRGYYNGNSEFDLRESFVCDNDSVLCSEIMATIWMSLDTDESMEQIYAVPNPFRTGTSAQTTPYYHNYGDGEYIRFHNVPSKAKLRIYTVSGDLVWKYDPGAYDIGDGILTWNVRNMEGLQVGSGVYIYRCENAGGEDAYGKIVVIR